MTPSVGDGAKRPDLSGASSAVEATRTCRQRRGGGSRSTAPSNLWRLRALCVVLFSGTLPLLRNLFHLFCFRAAASAEQFQSFGEDLFEVFHAPALQEHVPVGAYWFGGLGFLALSVPASGALGAVDADQCHVAYAAV